MLANTLAAIRLTLKGARRRGDAVNAIFRVGGATGSTTVGSTRAGVLAGGATVSTMVGSTCAAFVGGCASKQCVHSGHFSFLPAKVAFTRSALLQPGQLTWKTPGSGIVVPLLGL